MQRPLGPGSGCRERALYGRVRGRYKWIHVIVNVASSTLTDWRGTGRGPSGAPPRLKVSFLAAESAEKVRAVSWEVPRAQRSGFSPPAVLSYLEKLSSSFPFLL